MSLFFLGCFACSRLMPALLLVRLVSWVLYVSMSNNADAMLVEYMGEVVRQCIADLREVKYEEMGVGSCYLFRADADAIVDATRKGNLARFINHCCDVSFSVFFLFSLEVSIFHH